MGFLGIGSGKGAQRRHERRMARIEARTERKANRQDAKTQRTEIRAHAREVAFENGIDPNASMWGGLSSMTSSLGQAAGSIFGGGGGGLGGLFGGGGGMSPAPGATGTVSVFGSPMIWLLGAAVAIFFFFSRSKRR